MFNKKNKMVFVVGAGASKEVNLPIGVELTKIIANKLDIRFERYGDQMSGDYDIIQALKRYVKLYDNINGNINPYVRAAWRIRDAMPQAISIDNYIDSHGDNDRIALCGKLAISQAILESERNSFLMIHGGHQQEQIDYNRLNQTWYAEFFRVLTQNASWNDIGDRLRNITFISFNYDRCIEHYLFNALKNYYGRGRDEVADTLNALEVISPYGTVGKLSWQSDQNFVEFGSSDADLLKVSSRIKTFTEKVEDEGLMNYLKQKIGESDIVVYLGFAFHEQNLRLISIGQCTNQKCVYASSYKVSHNDVVDIQKRLISLFNGSLSRSNLKIEGHYTCYQLFREYWRALSLS